jgi:hypothetical protein
MKFDAPAHLVAPRDRLAGGPGSRDALLARLAAWIRRAVAGHRARREAYLSASVDLKDYEYRLKTWQEDEDHEHRLRRALWP